MPGPATLRRIRFRFGRDDLLRTRFAISPLIELVAATYVLRLPRHFPEHRPWIDRARARVDGLDLSLLYAVNPLGRTAWPNFNAPPPVSPHPRIEDELDRVAATDPQVAAADLRRAFPDDAPDEIRHLADDPAAALPVLVEQARAFWDATLAPWWQRISAFLESEIAARARRLVTLGSATAFGDLGADVTWDGHEVTVPAHPMPPVDVDLAGRGLLLIPSVLAFGTWPRVHPPWDPALTYQPRGVADVWRHDDRRDALERLIGRRRAAILRSLARPASTLTLAARIGASPGGVSTHLTALRRAGLVTQRRAGREVVYSRTATGDLLSAEMP